MADENNQYIALIVFALVFFFIGGLKLYQEVWLTGWALIVASILIFISYLLINSDLKKD